MKIELDELLNISCEQQWHEICNVATTPISVGTIEHRKAQTYDGNCLYDKPAGILPYAMARGTHGPG